MRILNTIGEGYTTQAKEILADSAEVDYQTLTQEDIGEIIGGYDILVVGLGLTFNREVLERAKNLKVIATATTGLDHIDIEFAKEKGVDVLSLRGEEEFLDTITGTAELAWGLLLDLARKLPHAFDAVKKGEWKRENFRGHNLWGKTLGVVGMGRLGRWVAAYGKAFGMDVFFYDPNVPAHQTEAKKTTFDELLRESDVISIHVHLNDKTAGMFGKKEFQKMKRTARLINTSRGKIVDEKELLNALRREDIAGYASDVLSGELLFGNECGNDPLVRYAREHDNVILVPHIGGMTHESRERTDIFIAEKLKNHLTGDT